MSWFTKHPMTPEPWFLVACDGDRGVASMLIEPDEPFLSNRDKADFLRRHAKYVFRIVDGDEMKRLMLPPGARP